MDCSLPGSSLQGISQARILEWVAISSSRGSSRPRDQTQVSCIVGRFCSTKLSGKSPPNELRRHSTGGLDCGSHQSDARLERRWHRDGSAMWARKGQGNNSKQIQVSGRFARTLAGRGLDSTSGARQALRQDPRDHGSRLTLGPDHHPRWPSLFKSHPLLNSLIPVRCQDWKRTQFAKLSS